jgi:hypothetical protein
MLLTLLPIVGPIIQSLVDAFSKHEDVTLQKQVDANKTALGKQQSTDQTDLGIIQARAQVAIAFKDDTGTRLIRDLVMFPVSAWTACYYYTLMVPDYSWKVNVPPDAMQYIPYAVIAFLFVTAYRGR